MKEGDVDETNIEKKLRNVIQAFPVLPTFTNLLKNVPDWNSKLELGPPWSTICRYVFQSTTIFTIRCLHFAVVSCCVRYAPMIIRYDSLSCMDVWTFHFTSDFL